MYVSFLRPVTWFAENCRKISIHTQKFIYQNSLTTWYQSTITIMNLKLDCSAIMNHVLNLWLNRVAVVATLISTSLPPSSEYSMTWISCDICDSVGKNTTVAIIFVLFIFVPHALSLCNCLSAVEESASWLMMKDQRRFYWVVLPCVLSACVFDNNVWLLCWKLQFSNVA